MPSMSIARIRGPIAPLLAHFAVRASRNFVRALQPLAAASTTIEIYDVTRIDKL